MGLIDPLGTASSFSEGASHFLACPYVIKHTNLA